MLWRNCKDSGLHSADVQPASRQPHILARALTRYEQSCDCRRCHARALYCQGAVPSARRVQHGPVWRARARGECPEVERARGGRREGGPARLHCGRHGRNEQLWCRQVSGPSALPPSSGCWLKPFVVTLQPAHRTSAQIICPCAWRRARLSTVASVSLRGLWQMRCLVKQPSSWPVEPDARCSSP